MQLHEIDVAGISAGMGALNLAKTLRRVNEGIGSKLLMKADKKLGVKNPITKTLSATLKAKNKLARKFGLKSPRKITTKVEDVPIKKIEMSAPYKNKAGVKSIRIGPAKG